MQRKVSDSQKKRVAGRQRYKCAASVPNYPCPLNGEPFDESGYEIDHIIELRDGGSNDLSNLQALCPMCHRVKTSRKTSEMSRSSIKQTEDSSKKCHHCHSVIENLKKKSTKWYCQLHDPIICKQFQCFGKDEIHTYQNLQQYRHIPKEIILPNGKTLYHVTNSI